MSPNTIPLHVIDGPPMIDFHDALRLVTEGRVVKLTLADAPDDNHITTRLEFKGYVASIRPRPQSTHLRWGARYKGCREWEIELEGTPILNVVEGPRVTLYYFEGSRKGVIFNPEEKHSFVDWLDRAHKGIDGPIALPATYRQLTYPQFELELKHYKVTVPLLDKRQILDFGDLRPNAAYQDTALDLRQPPRSSPWTPEAPERLTSTSPGMMEAIITSIGGRYPVSDSTSVVNVLLIGRDGGSYKISTPDDHAYRVGMTVRIYIEPNSQRAPVFVREDR